MTEVWRPVPTWEHRYEVSDMGRIRSLDVQARCRNGHFALRRGRMLVQVPKGGRYLAVTFAEGERREQHMVHLVVLSTFVGPANGLLGLHRDDDKGNNALSNLYYGTAQQNSDDRAGNLGHFKGSAHPMAKLTEDDVRDIRASEWADKDLAARYGVAPSHIWSVRNRRTWKHIS